MKINKFTCIDSFSGAGGLSYGLKKVGFNILLSFDNDEKSIETQKINTKYFNHPALLKDINKFSPKELLKKLKIKKGELFLFAGGPPCQGFSIQRIGNDKDDRNQLILKYFNFIKELEPKFFLVENVPGILGKRGVEVVTLLEKKAESIGYTIYKKILNAQDYGVPQRRRRVFLIGVRNDLNHAPFEFPKVVTPEGKRVTVREALGHLPAPPVDGTDHPKIIHHRRDKNSPINVKRLMALKEGQGRDFLPKELLAECHKRDSSKIGHRNVYGRMRWDDVAPTITARFDSFTRGMFGHPEQIRSVTLREGAMLQTFPNDFVFAGNKVDIARQIGNAVPPKLAMAVGKEIIRYYQKSLKSK